MPTLRQLSAGGRFDLAKAIVAHGGVVYWAARLGLRLGRGQDRRPYGDVEAVAEIKTVLAQCGYLPAADQLRQDGYPRLASYLQRHGGSRAVCTRLREQLFA